MNEKNFDEIPHNKQIIMTYAVINAVMLIHTIYVVIYQTEVGYSTIKPVTQVTSIDSYIQN